MDNLKLTRSFQLSVKGLILFISICFFSACQEEENKTKTDLDKMNLKGAVRRVQLFWYSDKNNKKIPTSTDIQYFNKKGRLIKSIEKYKLSNGNWMISTNIYNQKGDLSREYSNLSKLKVFHKYEYNKKGLKTKELYGTKEFGFDRSVRYQYNQKNLLVKEIHKEDTKTYTRTFSYDTNENLIHLSICRNGKEVTNYYCKYDDNDQLVWYRYQGENGNCTRALTLNDNGDIIKENSVGISYKDEDWVEFDDVSMKGFSVNPKSYTVQSKFKYDKNNNWVSCTYYSKDERPLKRTRMITYYSIE